MSNATLCMYKGPASGLKNNIGHWAVCVLDTVRQTIKHRRLIVVQYSHAELEIDGMCYSSSFRDGGVRAKVIPDLVSSGHFDLFPITINVDKALDQFHADEGKHYSWVAMERILFPWLPRRDATQRFCSDECAAMAGLPDPETYSPYDLLYALVGPDQAPAPVLAAAA